MEKITEVELLKEIEKNPYPLMWYAIGHEIMKNILETNKGKHKVKK